MSGPDASDRVLTVPNLLSFARLLGVPVFLWLILGPQADVAAFVLLVLAGASDWVDGYLARRLDQRLTGLAMRSTPACEPGPQSPKAGRHTCWTRRGARRRPGHRFSLCAGRTYSRLAETSRMAFAWR